MLPTAYPVAFANFNYAPISVVVAIAIICLAWYLPRYGARGAFLESTRSLHISPSGKVGPQQLPTCSQLLCMGPATCPLHVPSIDREPYERGKEKPQEGFAALTLMFCPDHAYAQLGGA